MAFRAVIVIDPNADSKTELILFKRTFMTVEKQYKVYVGDKAYKKIPPNVVQLIIDVLKVENVNSNQNQVYSNGMQNETPPIFDIFHSRSSQLVAFVKFGLIYSCITFDENIPATGTFVSTGVIFAYSMLESIATYIGGTVKNELFQSKLSNLHKYVSIGFPFGVPIELNIHTVLQMATSIQSNCVIPKVKSPSWRPISYRGKQLLNISIKESVSALLFDRENLANDCEIYGTIICKADVEEAPEVSLQLVAPIKSATLNQMVYHPSVQVVDDIAPVMKRGNNEQKSFEMESGSRKLRFCPPPQEFSLCHYKAKVDLDELPVHCFYQMKGDEQSLFILIQIKLNEKMKKSFEKFDVFIPFFNRGPISSTKVVQQSYNVTTCKNKAALIWNIGSRVGSKTNNISLEAVITFDTTKPAVFPDDKLIDLNSYIMIHLKMLGFTYSGLTLDQKSVELYPSSKIKVNSVSEFKTVEYKIWNSHGEVSCVTYST